jgi:hypothetical protein
MQKWEYIYFVIRDDREYFINGISYRFKPNETLFTIMDKLGKEGWELVTQPSIVVRTFKRPLEE